MKKVFGGMGLIIVIILIWAAFRPENMTVSREVTIKSTPEKLFPFINNSKKSNAWMPWSESDPTVQFQYSGPEEGLGAKSSWTGKEMGVGEAEVIESNPNQSVKTQLTYTEPFEMSQLAEVSLLPQGQETVVKWSVSGKQNYLFKLIGIFFSSDQMIGKEFERGLSRLKVLAENEVVTDEHSH